MLEGLVVVVDVGWQRNLDYKKRLKEALLRSCHGDWARNCLVQRLLCENSSDLSILKADVHLGLKKKKKKRKEKKRKKPSRAQRKNSVNFVTFCSSKNSYGGILLFLSRQNRTERLEFVFSLWKSIVCSCVCVGFVRVCVRGALFQSPEGPVPLISHWPDVKLLRKSLTESTCS